MFDYNNQTNAIMQNQQMMNTYFENLKNQFTPGYKAETVNFNDMMSASIEGSRAKVRQNGILFTQGTIVPTQTPTDLAISGNGFFVVGNGNRPQLTRDGRFTFAPDGSLKHSTGQAAMGYSVDEYGNAIAGQPQPVALSADPSSPQYMGRYTAFHFDETGKLYGELTTTDALTKQTVQTAVPLFQMAVASCANPSGLAKSGTTTFQATQSSGPAVYGTSGQGAMGIVRPQSLEMSNVDMAQQSAAIGQAKQNYEANFAAYKAMDNMTQSAIGLIK